ncbi:MAG TPA: hypothetical protein VHJ83_13490, partial [Micromonosporaceae bacterium]|nr:hypothetical protein [Micromonosporaceae bacterium]
MGGHAVADSRYGFRPVLLAVVKDPGQLDRIEGELQRSFGGDFRVRGERNAKDAVQFLQTVEHHGQRLAVVLVDDALPDEQRTEVLSLARSAHPDARRALLVEWGSWANRDTASTILSA